MLTLSLIAALAAASPGSGQRPDPTAAALSACLAKESNASTAGQTSCEGEAARAYDRRLNAAYTALMRRLPAGAAAQLRAAQRSWIAFRDAELKSSSAFYETRQGTMYVAMQAADETALVRDRAIELERKLSILGIDD